MKSAPRAVELVLVIVLALLLAKFVWLIVEPLPTPIGDLAAPAARAAAPAVVASNNPFPKQAIALASETAPIVDVEETTLDLTLTGVWTGDDYATAVIKLPSGEQKSFAIGDTVVPGVTLDAVYSNQVMLLRNGLREALKFEKKLTTPSVAPQPVAQRNQGVGAIAQATPSGLADIVRLAPAADGSGGFAIQLYASRNRAAFAALGLKEGDRLMSINGVAAPTDASRLSALLGQMQRAETASVVVRRAGEDITLDLSLSSVGVIQ